MADLAAILKSGKFHPSTQKRLEDAEKGPVVVETMDRLKLDAADWGSEYTGWRQ